MAQELCCVAWARIGSRTSKTGASAMGYLPAIFVFVALLLGGCASPGTTYDREASRLSLALDVRDGAGFVHRLYRNRLAEDWRLGTDDPGVRALNVYLDGDGRPWAATGVPADDPTPRNALVLRLMRLDPNPSLYLGRPCYIVRTQLRRCHPWFWTHGRYSERVVSSMAAALQREADDLSVDEIRLIGYSGGGALAMLISSRIDRVTDVLTVAANLDIDEWVDYHGYSQLVGSLNPIDLLPLNSTVKQSHWLGEIDVVVPPELARKSLLDQKDARAVFEILPGAGHLIGWEENWLSILKKVFD